MNVRHSKGFLFSCNDLCCVSSVRFARYILLILSIHCYFSFLLNYPNVNEKLKYAGQKFKTQLVTQYHLNSSNFQINFPLSCHKNTI